MMQVDSERQEHYTSGFTVDRTPAQAYEAVLDVRGWWSQAVEGVTDRVGGVFDYHFQDIHRCRIRVTELTPGEKVVWHVEENYFDFTEDQAEWTGTDIVFDLRPADGGTEVRFTHVGLVPQHECYDVCSNAWGGYITGSLRSLIATGQGHPNPKDDGPAPDHQDAATTARAEHSPTADSASVERA
ncbi:MAG: SRPBCC domain-containing protein [Catenulispora sp.]|nr:SRPBCC domain-containing protein [Catenulispora sp.]